MKLAKISIEQVPKHLRGKWGKGFQLLGRVVLGTFGWNVTGSIPNEERIVIIAAPHTSNWDFIYALISRRLNLHSCNFRFRKLRKEDIFDLKGSKSYMAYKI